MAGQGAQRGLVFTGGNAQRDLLVQLGRKLGRELDGFAVVQAFRTGTGAVQIPDLVMRGPLHADQHAAHLTCLGRPGLHQIINGLPAAEVQVADTEIGSLRHGQRGAQCAQQVLINVVEDPGHLPPVFVGIVHAGGSVNRQKSDRKAQEILRIAHPQTHSAAWPVARRSTLRSESPCRPCGRSARSTCAPSRSVACRWGGRRFRSPRSAWPRPRGAFRRSAESRTARCASR